MTPPLMLTAAEAATFEGVSERHLRRLVANGSIEAERSTIGRNASALLIAPSSLSPAGQARFYASQPELLAPHAGEAHADSFDVDDVDAGHKTTPSYAGAPQPLRQRALLRLEAVLTWRRALAAARRDGVTLGDAESAWLLKFRREHRNFKVSIASVKRWDREYRASGNSIDALVDGNDGHGRKGQTTLDPELEADFRALWLQPTRPKVSQCYRVLAKLAKVRGLTMPSYSTFLRLAASIPQMAIAALRYEEESSIRPFIPRDYNFPALDLIQSDHHQSDVAVHCGDPLCDRGHFPWVTGWVDVRSRKVLTFDVFIDCPNSRAILRTLKRTILEFGIPGGAYIDNGLDYKKALGWCVLHRQWGRERAKLIATDIDGPQIEHRLAPLGMRVVFSLPYNPQAKLIERFWRTLVDQAWRMFPSFRGSLGQRSEEAERLRRSPQELPLLTDLVIALQRAVDEYNAAPHSGDGMNGRSPDVVFAAERRAHVSVSAMELALVFLEKEERKVDKNGIRFAKRVYRLDDPAAQARWFGETVRVFFDPEDDEQLILTSLDGTFVSLAHERDRATYNSRDAKTQEQYALKARDWKAIKARIRAENPAAAKRLERIASSLDEYHALVAEQKALPIAAAGGSGIVQMLPYESSLARAVEDARARVANPSNLSAADLELARSVDAPSTDDLAAFASEHSFGGVITPRFGERRGADDDAPMSDVFTELEERRLQRKAAEREAEGMCGYDMDCPNQAEFKGLCLSHYDELHGA